jgi:octaprenyl-diphosphate synthase
LTSITHIVDSSILSDTVAFLEMIRPDMEAVETRIQAEITSEVRQVNTLASHVLYSGGKRLRPAMVSLAARTVNENPAIDRLEVVGAAAELVHMATLVHDDVVDNTSTRRGQPTANAIFGNGVAVLSGDFLLARAMCLLVHDGDIRIIRAVTEITVEMSEGEVLEILATNNPSLPYDHYFEILRKKTAVFVEGCCRCGAIVGGADAAAEAALAEFGHHLGMAFQIADDLLDYAGNPVSTGKAIGSDLRDGRVTLPLLLALHDASETDRKLFLTSFGNSACSDEDVNNVVNAMAGYNVFERTRAVALMHKEQADSALAQLPPGKARDAFSALTEYVIQRDR